MMAQSHQTVGQHAQYKDPGTSLMLKLYVITYTCTFPAKKIQIIGSVYIQEKILNVKIHVKFIINSKEVEKAQEDCGWCILIR